MPKCQTFSFVDDLLEVKPGALYMRSVVGDTVSVGVVKFVAPGAEALPMKEHAHGEEASLQINGGCDVYQGVAGAEPKHAVRLEPGTVMIVPADEAHYGANAYDAAGLSVRLNVVTPPRADYGTKAEAKVYSHQVGAKG